MGTSTRDERVARLSAENRQLLAEVVRLRRDLDELRALSGRVDALQHHVETMHAHVERHAAALSAISSVTAGLDEPGTKRALHVVLDAEQD